LEGSSAEEAFEGEEWRLMRRPWLLVAVPCSISSSMEESSYACAVWG